MNINYTYLHFCPEHNSLLIYMKRKLQIALKLN